ncbi:PAS domain-containing protein [Tumidithrix helvetica PCC 7403]|uniref:ATP-binding protein n=1 Tax=Tumidithrix helvetica TaxID=3457545 RepID=UPI003CBD3839
MISHLDFTQAGKIQRTMEVLSALSYRAGELSAYLESTAKSVSELVGLDWSVVTLCQDGLERVLASSIDIGEAANAVYELHGTLTGQVVESGHCLAVENTDLNKEYGEPPEGYQSYLGVPLRLPTGSVIGTICSFHQQPRKFTLEEIRLVEVFAERAATAIDNYNLYQQQQELNQKLQQEIEERKAVEQALREREEQLRQIAENLEPVVWMYSHDGIPLYISPPFEKIFGISSELWYRDRHAWKNTIHSEDREQVYAAFDRFDTQKFDLEYRIIRPDGQVRIIRDRSFPIVDNLGQVYRIAGIAEDITERKQEQEKTLQAMQRLSELGGLAATIVHEVRNPLTTVLMGLTYFQRLELSDGARKRLDLSLEEAERLKRLLNEILLFAKREVLLSESVELNDEIAEIVKNIASSPIVAERQIEFYPLSVPIYVSVDRDKFKQVLINLLQNACEAVAVGDSVFMHVRCDDIRSEVLIQICNGGDRIHPEILAKLTEPFFTTKPSGNGLGLAIVKKIVEAHGGSFKLEPGTTGGAIVDVRLPINYERTLSAK